MNSRRLSIFRKLCHAGLPLFLALAVFSGCATTKEKRLEKDGITLVYRDPSAAGSEVAKLRLDHPVKMSAEQMKNHLLSLQYEELSLLGKRKYVFSQKGLDEVSRLFTKAVNHLTPKTILTFEVDTPRGLTRGDIFASHNKLNFRFESIKGSDFASNSFAAWKGSTWRLVPTKGQRFHVTKRLLGTATKENWIVANLTLPKTSRRTQKNRKTGRSGASSKEPDASQEPAGKNTDLEKKLEFLKELHEKDLIDDTEYEKKRKELLDTYL
ncbi:MAG: SHOCT domain-containing protein [Nitrospinaceae bacterium]